MKIREVAIACRNLVYGGSFASMLMLRRPRSAVKYVSECLFLKGCMEGGGKLAERQVWEAFGQTEAMNVRIHTAAAADWFRSVASYTADLVSLCMLCQMVNPKVIFEIGTYHGSGTLHLACNSPEATVFTLDLGDDRQPALRTTSMDRLHIFEHARTERMLFEGTPEESRIVQLYGDSSNFDFTPWSNRVDLFFIDGAHSYSYVRSDTLKALECCHPGSVLVWHDYGRFGINGVSRWLHQFVAEGHQVNRIPGGSLAYMQVQASDLRGRAAESWSESCSKDQPPLIVS